MGITETNTFVADVRCDIRKIAAIAKTLSEQDQAAPESISALLRTIVENFHAALFQAGLLKPVANTSEALMLMEELGYRGTRKSANLVAVKRALAVEALLGKPIEEDEIKREQARQALKDL